jgi:hypothetical protein
MMKQLKKIVFIVLILQVVLMSVRILNVLLNEGTEIYDLIELGGFTLAFFIIILLVWVYEKIVILIRKCKE